MKNKFFLALGIAVAALGIQSCSSVIDGEIEDYKIEKKWVGDLTLTEPMAAAVKSFEVKDLVVEGREISSIEFLGDGKCIISWADSELAKAPRRASSIGVEEKGIGVTLEDGKKVYLSPSYAPSIEEGIKIDASTVEYTYAEGIYTFRVDGHTLEIDGSGVKVDSHLAGSVSEMTEYETSMYTERLAHVWGVETGIVKLYKGAKLVATITISGDDLHDNGIDLFAFTKAGTILRVTKDGNEVGKWGWRGITSEKNLVASYRIPGVASGDANVYFVNNNLYVEQEINISLDGTLLDSEDLGKYGLKDLTAMCIFRASLSNAK